MLAILYAISNKAISHYGFFASRYGKKTFFRSRSFPFFLGSFLDFFSLLQHYQVQVGTMYYYITQYMTMFYCQKAPLILNTFDLAIFNNCTCRKSRNDSLHGAYATLREKHNDSNYKGDSYKSFMYRINVHACTHARTHNSIS